MRATRPYQKRAVSPPIRQAPYSIARGNRSAGTAPTERVGENPGFLAKCLGSLAPRAGFEPATIRLTVECSTAELPRNRRNKGSRAGAYNKAFRACKGPNHRRRAGVKRGRKAPALQRFVVVFRPPGQGGWNRGPCHFVIRRCDGPGRQFDSIGQKARSAGFHGS